MSVLSAVKARSSDGAAEERSEDSVSFESAFVGWISSTRRFYDQQIVYDDRGRALGYAAFDACAGECPRIEDLSPELTDLDSFDVRVSLSAGKVEVGAFRPGAVRQAARTWITWRRPGSKEDMLAANEPPLSPLPLGEALSRPKGRYVLVQGQLVRSTSAEPALCEDTVPCTRPGFCDSVKLPLNGVPGGRAVQLPSVSTYGQAAYERVRSGTFIDARSGVFLARRDGPGFSLVAGGFTGSCSSGPPL